MSTHNHSDTPVDQPPQPPKDSDLLSEASAMGAARRVGSALHEAAEDLTDAGRDAARRANDIYRTVAMKAGDAMATSRTLCAKNPVPLVLGAVVFGAAIGYLLTRRQRKPTFSARYAEEPLAAVRDAILGALAPVTKTVHKGYDSALEGAEKVMGHVHNFGPRRGNTSLTHQLGRMGHTLKFW